MSVAASDLLEEAEVEVEEEEKEGVGAAVYVGHRSVSRARALSLMGDASQACD